MAANTNRSQIPLGTPINGANGLVNQQWAFWLKDLFGSLPPAGAGYVIDGTAGSTGPTTLYNGPASNRGSNPADNAIYFANDTGQIFTSGQGTWHEQSPELVGDVLKSALSNVTTLKTVNFSPGTYGNGLNIPTIVVNEKGLVTSATSSPIDLTVYANGTTGSVQINIDGKLGAATDFQYDVTPDVQSLNVPNINIDQYEDSDNVLRDGQITFFNPIPTMSNLSPNTTKGDLIGHDGLINVRVPVGADGRALIADSTFDAGVSYQDIVNSVEVTSADLTVTSASDVGHVSIDLVLNTVPISKGGTGEVTQQLAINALAGGVTAGTVLRGDGTNIVLGPLDLATDVTGILDIVNGGTGQATKQAAFDALSPLDTKGDVLTFDGTNNIKIGVGTDGQVLTADSGSASGLSYQTPTIFTSPLTTKGDLFGFGTTDDRVPVGTDGQALVADSTNPLGVSYQTITGGGTPGGADTELQFNNAGAFGGMPEVKYTPAQLELFQTLVTNDGAGTTSVVGNSAAEPDFAIGVKVQSGDYTSTPGVAYGAKMNLIPGSDSAGGNAELIAGQFDGAGGAISYGAAMSFVGGTPTLGGGFALSTGGFSDNSNSSGAITFNVPTADTSGDIQFNVSRGTSSTGSISFVTGDGGALGNINFIAAPQSDLTPGSGRISFTTGTDKYFNILQDGAWELNADVGTAGQVLTSGGVGVQPTWTTVSGGSGSPGGLNTQLQFNNAGAFDGTANIVYDLTDNSFGLFNSKMIDTSGIYTPDDLIWTMNDGTAFAVLSGTSTTGGGIAKGAVVLASPATSTYVTGISYTASTGRLDLGQGVINDSYGNIISSGSFNLTEGTLNDDGSSAIQLQGGSFSLNSGAASGVATPSGRPSTYVTGGDISLITGSGDKSGSINIVTNSATDIAGDIQIGTGGSTGAQAGAVSITTGSSADGTTGGSFSVSTGAAGARLTISQAGAFGLGNAVDEGTVGQVITSQGPGAVPTWTTVSGGSGSPGGSDTELQFNNAGAFGGITEVTYTSGTLGLFGSTVTNDSTNTVIKGADGNPSAGYGVFVGGGDYVSVSGVTTTNKGGSITTGVAESFNTGRVRIAAGDSSDSSSRFAQGANINLDGSNIDYGGGNIMASTGQGAGATSSGGSIYINTSGGYNSGDMNFSTGSIGSSAGPYDDDGTIGAIRFTTGSNSAGSNGGNIEFTGAGNTAGDQRISFTAGNLLNFTINQNGGWGLGTTSTNVGTAGQVLTSNAGAVPSWETPASSSPLTTKGDLYGFDTVNARVPVGYAGYSLESDPIEPTGLSYYASGMTSDLVYSDEIRVIPTRRQHITMGLLEIQGSIINNGTIAIL